MRKERKYGVDVIINKSYNHILPMLGDDCGDFINLTGCFIGDGNHPEWDNQIFLLFKHAERKDFLNFEKRLTHHPFYIKRYKPDEDHLMYIFNVPKEYQKDYDAFKDSKYSELSEDYKRQIIKFHHFSKYGYGSSTIKILYRDAKLYDEKEEEINRDIPERDWTYIPRNQEIGERLHEEDEIFNYKVKEKV